MRDYTSESGSSLVFQLYVARHSLMKKKQHKLLDSQVCFRVPPAQHLNGLLTMLKNITAFTLSSVKLSQLCPTINESKSLEKVFQCFLQVLRTMFIF
jgi:hypothetical protein